jgi:hypothetical protein
MQLRVNVSSALVSSGDFDLGLLRILADGARRHQQRAITADSIRVPTARDVRSTHAVHRSGLSWKVYDIRPMLDARPVYLCDAIRTPFGRYGGALSAVRTDDLAAIPLARSAIATRRGLAAAGRRDLRVRESGGEDNRNVGANGAAPRRIAGQRAGSTVNRLCGSSMDAVAIAARAIAAGEMDLAFAGGVESMSRAPFVMNKADAPFARGDRARGHHARLAFREREDEAALRYGFDVGDC